MAFRLNAEQLLTFAAFHSGLSGQSAPGHRLKVGAFACLSQSFTAFMSSFVQMDTSAGSVGPFWDHELQNQIFLHSIVMVRMYPGNL